MPYKNKSALKVWLDRNREKVRSQTNERQKRFWTKHVRPKLPPFDLSENRRRIKELKVLGIHLRIDKKPDGFSVSPTLVQDANSCINGCGETKRLVVLDTVVVKLPRIVLRFPYQPLDEKFLERASHGEVEEAISRCANHCQHFRFDDIESARNLACGFRFQCDCDFRFKRRLTFDSYEMEVAFCYDCLKFHFEEYNFELCQLCVPKLFRRKKTGVLRPRFHSLYPEGYPEEMRYPVYCRLCKWDIKAIAGRIQREETAPQREVERFKDALAAIEKTAFLDDPTITAYEIAERLGKIDLRQSQRLTDLENVGIDLEDVGLPQP